MIRTIFAFLLLPLSARAELFTSPVSTALGGAGAASVQILESSHLNPATLPFLSGYYGGFLYGSSTQPTSPGGPTTSTTGMGVAITDATPEVFAPATFSYVKGTQYVGKTPYDQTELHLGFGYRLFQNVTMGLAAVRLTENHSAGPMLEDFNATTGFLVTPNKNMGIALVFHDMLNTQNIDMTPVTTAGFFWMYKQAIRFMADVSQPQKDNPNRQGILSLGVENMIIGDGVGVRVGGRWDQVVAERFGSTGLGWNGPNLSIDYAYEKNLDADEFRHLVDMRVQF